VKLDPIGDGETMPAKRHVIIMRDGFIGARVERGRQGERDLALESVTGDITHLVADRLEALTFSLTDFDR